MQYPRSDSFQSNVHRAQPQTEVLGALFAEHERYVRQSLRRLGVAACDEDDLVQDVFMVVMHRLGDFEQRGKTRGWLFGIALRVVAGHRRRGFRRFERMDGDKHVLHVAALDPGPESQALARSETVQLHALLDRLPPERRLVLELFELQEMGCAQIAAQERIPIGTVYSRLHAARREFESLALRAAC